MYFKSGLFPDSQKITEVVPLFKKDDLWKATNYRPITLLSQFNKILKKIIYHRPPFKTLPDKKKQLCLMIAGTALHKA